MKKHTTTTPIRTRRKPLITALEPRILLDGAAVVTMAEMATDVAFESDAVHNQGAEQSVHFAAPAPIAAESSNRREVAFVDTSVNDYQSLVDGLGDGIEVILINGNDNGLEQMVASLQGQSGIDAIHLFSHGSVGELKLGTLTLNADSVQANAGLLSTLGASLTETGDLMLYGCYVGADSEGQSFIDSIASLTLADVAASEDLTGAEGLGGNWVLEAGSGLIETSAAAVAGYDATLAPALVVSDLSDLTYKEGDGTVLIDGDVSISGSSDYTGGYLDFAIDSATTAESLGFLTDSTPSSASGQVSIVGSTVFRGDGSSAIVIGSVDTIKNGKNGQPLRINFSNAFENGNFQDGTNGSTVIKGWTSVLDSVRLDGVDQIAGQTTPIDQTYTSQNQTDAKSQNGGKPIGDNTSGGNFTKTAQLSNYEGQSGTGDLAIRLNTGSASIDQGYGVIRGPYVYSNGTVSLQAGDTVSFDWKALSGGDAYDAYGYIVDVNTGKTVTILDSTGTSDNQETAWANQVTTISAGQAGVYRFVFVAGSYDLTGGRLLGGELMIDNVKVTQANPPGPIGDATITAISQRVTYTNTAADYADLTRHLQVSALDKAGNTGSATSLINLVEENNAPSFSGDASLASVNEDTTSPAGSSVSALFAGLFVDVDANYDPKDALAGIIITADASDSAQGQWQYSTDGSNWHAVGSVSADAGLLLASTASLRFVPAADYNGTPGSLSVHAVDSSFAMSFTNGATRATFNTSVAGNTGGTTAVSSSAVSLGTSITAVNDAPVLAAHVGATIVDTAEKDAFAAVAGKLTATDVDSSTLTYGIDGGTDDGTYVTSSSVYGTLKVTKLTGDYTFTPSSNVINGLNTTEVQNFTVTASDGALSSTQILKFTLQGVNDNPIFGAESGSTQVSVFSYSNLNGADDNPGNDNENANLASIVQSIINKGGQYTLDTSIQNFTDANFADKLNASGFFFMTDMEQFTSSFDPLSDTYLPSSAAETINNWVKAGGVIMMTGTAGTEDVEFLNRVFGWDLTSKNDSNWSLNADNAAGTPFEGGPSSLNAPSATDSIGAGTVDGFKAIYGTADNATVAEISFGAGRVLFLGYDYYDSGIAGTGFTANAPQYGADVTNGSSNTNAWVTEIIPRALEYSANLSSNTTLTETDSTLSTSGKFAVSDADQSDSVSVTVSGVSAEQRNAGGTAMTSSPSQPTLEKLQAMLDLGSQPVIDSTTTSANVDWVFNSNTEAFNYLAAGESLVLTYQLTANDHNGGTATRTLTITINGVNDAPVAQSVTQNVAENGLFEGNVPAASDVDGTIASYLLVSSVASGSGSLTFNPNGSYRFDPGTAFDYLAVGDSANVSFTYQAKDNSGAVSNTATITLTVVGSNDVPVVSASTATTSENGQITSNVPAASDVDGTIQSYQVVEDVSSGSLTFNSDGTYSFNTCTDFDDLAVGESRQVSFTYTATDNNDGVSAPGTVTFTITGTNDAPTITAVDVAGAITDGAILKDTGSITFADLDLTDRPTASEVTKSVTALRADKTTSLALSSTQQQAIEAAFSISAADMNANNGTINWTYDIAAKDVEFLAKDEVVTAVFTITVDDGKGGTATQDVTVTLTGSNDVPVITVVDVDAAITDGGTLKDTGSIKFADLDLADRPTASKVTKSVAAKLANGTTELPLTGAQKAAIEAAFSIKAADANANKGTIDWAYDIAADDLKFLAKGEVVTAVFTITVDDGQGGTATQDVTVTLTGSDDVPVITIVDIVGAITDGVKLTDAGSITFADFDLTDRPTASEVTKSVAALRADGTTPLILSSTQQQAIEAAFSITAADANANNGAINWAYNIAAGDLEFLAKGEVVTAIFTITVDDGQGGKVTQDVSVTLTGSNDGPVISIDAPADFIEQTDAAVQDLTQSGQVHFGDVDLTDSINISFASNKDIKWTRADNTLVADLPTGLAGALVKAFTTGADSQPHEGQIPWTYNASALDLDFLNAGDTITFSYTVTVTDSQDAPPSQVVTIRLLGTNDAPELTAYVLTKAETIVQKGADYKLDAAQLFSDKDSTLSREDLDFNITGLPAGLRYNPETGVISGKSTESGKFQVTVTATDAEGASISQTYELLVTAVVQGDTPSVPRDTTPISAPSVEPQQIKITVSDMPSGLLSNSGSQGAISDSSGYMASSYFTGGESSTFDSTLSSTQGEPLDAGMKKVGATEQVILSERGALVIQTQNPDGKTSVRASVDVSVMRDGVVVFTDVQREAFSSVALAVVSIERTADKVLTVTIQDTRQTGNSQLYTGSLSNGESLPSWIKLDPNTGTLTLSNRPAGQKEVSVRIQTIGSDGQARVLELNLDLDELFEGSSLVTDPALIETEGQEPIGFVPLSDQLEAELTAHNNYGDRLMALLQSA